MPIQYQGNSGVVGEIETTHRAIRGTTRPMELGARGAYSFGAMTGVLAATTTGEIFQMRWIDATRDMLLRSVWVAGFISTTAFAAGVPPQLAMRIARSWTVDGTGGTAIVFSTANTDKKRTDFPLSLLSDTGTRIATTGALGAGTKTLDTNRCAYLVGQAGNTTGSTYVIPPTYIWQRNTDDEYPFLFEQNEGFIIEIPAIPATGTWSVSVQVEWCEIDPATVTGW
ncbi:MAG TPA: hypothetical protein VLG09_04280 [Candidatus Saccharimonadales bacterium]|nr:hypothetical protein [Candidatus Saccharimonadales bacterium]